TADDGGVGTYGGTAPYKRATVLVLPGHLATRVQHVREHHAWPAEHIVLQLHALVDRHVVLDLHVIADPHVRHHYNVLAQGAVPAYHRPRHHVPEVPDAGAFTNLGTLVHVAGLVDERGRHSAWSAA